MRNNLTMDAFSGSPDDHLQNPLRFQRHTQCASQNDNRENKVMRKERPETPMPQGTPDFCDSPNPTSKKGYLSDSSQGSTPIAMSEPKWTVSDARRPSYMLAEKPPFREDLKYKTQVFSMNKHRDDRNKSYHEAEMKKINHSNRAHAMHANKLHVCVAFFLMAEKLKKVGMEIGQDDVENLRKVLADVNLFKLELQRDREESVKDQLARLKLFYPGDNRSYFFQPALEKNYKGLTARKIMIPYAQKTTDNGEILLVRPKQ